MLIRFMCHSSAVHTFNPFCDTKIALFAKCFVRNTPSLPSRLVYVPVAESQHKVPLSSGLVDIHLQDLVLGKGHLVEAVKDSGGGPRDAESEP